MQAEPHPSQFPSVRESGVGVNAGVAGGECWSVFDTLKILVHTLIFHAYTETMSGAKYEQFDFEDLATRATTVFQPRTPITTRDLFAGRWNELMAVVDAVNQVGLHAVIFGERGVGKTSLANVIAPTIYALDDPNSQDFNPKGRIIMKTVATSSDMFSSIWVKLFRDISLLDDRPVAGFQPGQKGRVSLLEAYGLVQPITVDDVRRVLTNIPASVFIIDEFDRVAASAMKEFTDLIKTLSDFSVDTTVVLVGVSDTIGNLVGDHASIVRAISQVFLRRMLPVELKKILTNAEEKLGVNFDDDAAQLIVHVSQGLPHYTHLIGLHAVRVAALNQTTTISRKTVFTALDKATTQAEQSTRDRHSRAIHSSHKDALYRHILLACAIAAAQEQDPLGYFTPSSVVKPLSSILGRAVEIATFNSHLSAFSQLGRGNVLERIGLARAYRFRFQDPMVVPFTFMDAVSSGIVDEDHLARLLSE